MEEVSEPKNSPKIPKFSRKKQLRQRRKSSDDEEAEEEKLNIASIVGEMKEIQKLRRRQNGVSVEALASGHRSSNSDEDYGKDSYCPKTGGMVDMKALMSGKMKRADDAYDTGIGTQFSAETNTRDEDAEMMKYIEVELAKKKGKAAEEGEESKTKKHVSTEEAALLAVPEALRKSSSKKSEEMLSNQMLSGIPEVDLGIEAKIKNIEATEEAKQHLLKDRLSKKEGPSQFVPTNMAVNFVQHNRFNIEDPEPPRKKERKEEKKKAIVVVGAEPGEKIERVKELGEKATDDYHYEKFKKQFKRY